MPTSFDALMQSETEHKEAVYKTFDKMKKDANASVRSSEAYIASGSYDDQEAFMVYGSMTDAKRKRHQVEDLLQKVYEKPYFAHVEMVEQGETASEHFYLSDNESLDETIQIGRNGYLLPFKQDPDRPISLALFHCYQAKKGENVSYQVRNGSTFVFKPLFICDDEIYNRQLLNAMQLFPAQELLSVNVDELLELKLQENRGDPRLRNIIATLQQKQFEIIETDASESFAVQGCAGSGKSQCLFHRLFFLRDILSQDGWDHVLLLTPTELFRNYSADLIKRYQLADVTDLSIAELYQVLLDRYDSRFRNRQYHFELTEEYLPDDYLQVVYRNDTIKYIETEIEKAIHFYTESGCKALDIEMPAVITGDSVSELVHALDAELNAYDERENVLQQDPDYIEHRNIYDQLQKELQSAQRSFDRLKRELSQIETEEVQLQKAVENYEDVKNELIQWMEQRRTRISAAYKSVSRFDTTQRKGFEIEAPARFMQELYTLKDVTEGEAFLADEDYRKFLDEYFEQAENDLAGLTQQMTADRQLERFAKRKGEIQTRINTVSQTIENYSNQVRENENWIRQKAAEYDGEKSKRTLRRADLERARYFLSRIESTVFEREVWNALAPIKEKNSIQTLSIEQLQDGHRRETRILYKSDLMFYVKIYARLHPDAKIPEYKLLCIDEGQDLHKADYDLLHQLYPEAAFNIFGDTEQVLHEACGIKDWKTESGVKKLFRLDRNYRNSAAIVEFCNNRFNCRMDYLGKPRSIQRPVEISDIKAIKLLLNGQVVVIVKDKRMYGWFVDQLDGDSGKLEFLDTSSVKPSGRRIPCYSVFAAKGLEFSDVIVVAEGMTTNQRIVACTRAMEKLYYYE